MKGKVLIIGVGSIGTRHLRNLFLLGYRNLAVCDPSQEKLIKASRLGNFRLYKDARRALEVEKPDTVFICNPTHFHVPSASLALRVGAHVFIEKPISHTLAGVDALAKKAKQKKRTVMVACNFRFQSGFQALEKVLRQKIFGTPLIARVTLGYFLPTARQGGSYKKVYAANRKEGGVLLDSGPHVLDYLISLFGKVESGTAIKSPLRPLHIQSEEAAVLMLKHRGGVLSSVALDYMSRTPTHRMEIQTSRGLLTLDMRGNVLTFEDEKTKKVLHKGTKDLNAMFLAELRHFLTCAKYGLRPKQDITMAEKTLRVLLAASRESIQ